MLESEQSFACANYILDKLESYKIKDITNLKLQKLLYFAYGIHLALYDTPLFDTPIQAWKLGPVVPSVYREFKVHGENPITTKAYLLKDDYSGEVILARYDDFSEEKQRSLSITCAAYGHEKASKLVDITHNYNKDRRGNIIKDEDIKAEFSQHISKLETYFFE